MKKLALLLTAFVGVASLQSCTIEEYYDDNNAYSQVFELTNETLSTRESDYTLSGTWNFTTSLYDSDNVLVYRWQGNSWALVPVTYPLGSGDNITYDYDFTRRDVKVYVSANFPINELSNSEYNEFVYRQTFRVVVVPGTFRQKMNFEDYNATISALGLDNTPVKTLVLKK